MTRKCHGILNFISILDQMGIVTVRYTSKKQTFRNLVRLSYLSVVEFAAFIGIAVGIRVSIGLSDLFVFAVTRNCRAGGLLADFTVVHLDFVVALDSEIA